MSIILQLRSVATSIGGTLFRTKLIADMGTIEDTLNLHQTVLDSSNQMSLDALSATSSSSVAIGTGSKSFTIQTGKSFLGGQYVQIADAALPSTNSMVGQVTSYNSGTGALVVESLYVRGSGTIASWVISLGAPAADIAAQINGATEKTTPVGADKVGIWDSVSGLLNFVSFTNLLNWFAAKAGNASQVFNVGQATAAAHAVRLDQTPAPFRNAAVNGDMSVSQVNGTTLVTTGIATNTYVIDQMIVNAATAAVTAGQSTDATGLPTGFRTNLKIAGAASNTGVKIKHRMEAKDVARFAGKKIAVSFYAYQDSGAAFASATVKAYCPTTTADTFSALTQEGSTQNISIANAGTIAKYTAFITMGASNVPKGLEIEIDTAAALLAGKTMYCTGLQIEAVASDATVGTEFEFLPFAEQLRLCQRYFESSYSQGVAVPTNNSSGPLVFGASAVIANNSYIGYVKFSVEKRTSPTVTTYSYTSSVAGKVSDGNGTDLAASSGLSSGINSIGSAFYNGSGGNITPASGAFMFHYKADARM